MPDLFGLFNLKDHNPRAVLRLAGAWGVGVGWSPKSSATSAFRRSRVAGACVRLAIEISPLQEGFRGACGVTFPGCRCKLFCFANPYNISYWIRKYNKILDIIGLFLYIIIHE